MKTHLVAMIPMAALWAGCGDGSSYDGPGKNLVGSWILTTSQYQTVVGANTSSTGGGGESVEIYLDGDTLMIDDEACAFPGTGTGDDTIVLDMSESCVREAASGGLYTHVVSSGSAVQAAGYLTIQISGQLRPLTGTEQGTFTIAYLGQPYTSPTCTDPPCDGGGGN